MAQVGYMLARSNAARKERQDRNEALEELCVLRSQVIHGDGVVPSEPLPPGRT